MFSIEASGSLNRITGSSEDGQDPQDSKEITGDLIGQIIKPQRPLVSALSLVSGGFRRIRRF